MSPQSRWEVSPKVNAFTSLDGPPGRLFQHAWRRARALWVLLVWLATLAVGLAGPAAAASRPPVRGTGGAVVCDEAAATEAGLEILRAGGNAVDAAVATALALAVVGPEAGNLGGGGFAVVRMSPAAGQRSEPAFLDFRETAPRAAHRNLYLDAAGESIPDASRLGPLAAGIPGSPAGYHALHARFGRLPWAQVVEPARKLAAEGFVLSERTRRTLGTEKARLGRFPESSQFWLPGGEPPPPGTRLRLPTLAATLQRYAEIGPQALMGGEAARAIEASSRKYGGILTVEDLAGYQPEWRQPLRYRAFGWEMASADLPASGGLVLATASVLLDRLQYGEKPRFGAVRAHLLAEVLRRVFADRYLLGEPATTQVTSAQLLEPTFLAERLASIDPARATPSEAVRKWGEGKAESADTTHLSVIDAEGNAVALTTTLNDLYGCALWVPEVGVFLNNEMDDFATAPGKPNLFGLIQGEANAVGPGKRMLSSQSPTVAWREEAGQTLEIVALGGRGGSRIPTATLQILLNLWVDGDELQSAVDRPRIHHQWQPDQIQYEADALAPETQAALIALGHRLEILKTVGQAHAARAQRQADGQWVVEAAADPRGGGGHAGIVAPWR